ncbi:MAG: nitroreductase, partial [Eubacterium sp.]
AAEMGLGGCMIGNYSTEAIREALHLEASLAPVLIIALGKPDEKIVLTEVLDDGKTDYYRDENDVHYVPKRRLKDIIIGD